MPRLTGLRAERVLSSRQFRDGQFQNTAPVTPGIKGNPLPVLREMFLGRKQRSVPAVLAPADIAPAVARRAAAELHAPLPKTLPSKGSAPGRSRDSAHHSSITSVDGFHRACVHHAFCALGVGNRPLEVARFHLVRAFRHVSSLFDAIGPWPKASNDSDAWARHHRERATNERRPQADVSRRAPHAGRTWMRPTNAMGVHIVMLR